MVPPVLPATEFYARRQRLLDALPASSLVIVAAATIRQRNGDNDYPFRQDSDFWYLTGFDEPDAYAFLSKDDQGQTALTLFVTPQDTLKKIWSGPVAGVEGAAAFGADQAYALAELSHHAESLCHRAAHIFWLQGRQDFLVTQILSWLQTCTQKRAQPRGLHDLKPTLHVLRQQKSPAEIEILRYVGRLSAEAHRHLLERTYAYEYEMAAAFQAYVYQRNCQLAYPVIVGGGAHACILHYTKNQAPLMSDTSVLVDAGAEWQYYAADITRTLPVQGKFTARQRDIYALVLRAQQAACELVQPGVPWDALQKAAVRILVEGLVELKILTGDIDTLCAEKAYRPFYMHSLGHWLGLDVHDAGFYEDDKGAIKLAPGMVFTIEPGLYFQPHDARAPEAWQGIGVRIEDNILVTEQGYEILTQAAPKELDEIER